MDLAAIPLTASHLESFSLVEKLDKGHFLHSFLQGQKPYTRKFAAEGKEAFSAWNQNTPEKKRPGTPAQAHAFGFESPVLRPRAPDPPLLPEQISSKGKASPLLRSVKDTRRQKKATPPSQTPLKKKRVVLQQKRALETRLSDDGDRVARMTERRERKRTKRATVQGKNNQETDGEERENEDKSSRRRAGKGKKHEGNKKPNIPAGFALMHGFAATNVGKNRLTLKPFPNVGVFGKGKASAKTQVIDRKRSARNGCQNDYFSEADFLNKVRDKPPPKTNQKNTPSVSELASISHLSSDTCKSVIRDVAELECQNEYPVVANGGEHQKTQVERDVPEVELEKPSSRSFSPSHHSKESDRVGDISLPLTNVCMPSIATTRDGGSQDLDYHHRTARGSFDDVAVPAPENGNSSPSLRPSQSASQCAPRMDLSAAMTATVSRYFPRVSGHSKDLIIQEDLPVVGTTLAANPPGLPEDACQDAMVSRHSHTSWHAVEGTEWDQYIQGDEPLHVRHMASNSQLFPSPHSSLEQALCNYVQSEEHVPQFMYDQEVPDHIEMSTGCEPLAHGSLLGPFDNKNREVDSWDFDGGLSWPGGYEYDASGKEYMQYDFDDRVNEAYGSGCEYLLGSELPWVMEVTDHPAIDDLGDEEDDLEFNSDRYVEFDEMDEAEFSYEGCNNVEANESDVEGESPCGSMLGDEFVDDSRDGSILVEGQFSQGRTLLLGRTRRRSNGYQSSQKFTSISRAEAAVAKALTGHWLPQKH